ESGCEEYTPVQATITNYITRSPFTYSTLDNESPYTGAGQSDSIGSCMYLPDGWSLADMDDTRAIETVKAASFGATCLSGTIDSTPRSSSDGSACSAPTSVEYTLNTVSVTDAE
ncbi:hypothetical protein KIPB_015980, partial [Kipferlia bialata]